MAPHRLSRAGAYLASSLVLLLTLSSCTDTLAPPAPDFDLVATAALGAPGWTAYVMHGSTHPRLVDLNTLSVSSEAEHLRAGGSGAITADGGTLFLNYGGRIQVVDARTMEVERTFTTYGATHLALSPDESTLWATRYCGWNSGGYLYAYDVETFDRVASMRITGDYWCSGPYRGVFTPDGRYLVTANLQMASVSVIDTKQMREIRRIAVPQPNPIDVAVSPDGRFAYVPGRSLPVIVKISLETLSVVDQLPSQGKPFGIDVAPDGTLYVTDYDNARLFVQDPDDGTMLAVVDVGNSPRHVFLTPDGGQAVVVNQNGSSVTVVETAGNTVQATVPVGYYPLFALIGRTLAGETLEDLAAAVQDLVDVGALSNGQGRSLMAKLDAAMAKVEAEQLHVAVNQLNAFINHVNAFESAGVLTAAQAQALVSMAGAIMESLSG